VRTHGIAAHPQTSAGDVNDGHEPAERRVVIVGGGFTGVGCARRLTGRDDVRFTLIDRNDYQQFQPLLYQVATSQRAPSDVAYALRKLFVDDQNLTWGSDYFTSARGPQGSIARTRRRSTGRTTACWRR
jgi:hypothetical protein